MLCGDLNEKEIQKRGDICILIADSVCCTAEANNTVKQLYPNNKKKIDLEEIEYLSRLITCKIKTVIKNVPPNEIAGPNSFTDKFYQTFKEDLISILLKVFQKK